MRHFGISNSQPNTANFGQHKHTAQYVNTPRHIRHTYTYNFNYTKKALALAPANLTQQLRRFATNIDCAEAIEGKGWDMIDSRLQGLEGVEA